MEKNTREEEWNEEEEEDEESASMVCDERGRNAMSRRQGLWRIEHGNVVLLEVVQSRADSGRVRVSVRASDEAMCRQYG